uniref:Transmembrane protein n=1 Tax=Caenorhabditis tropicalis TaxID=1561998 RepID=A0A1I7TEU3_9PELO
MEYHREPAGTETPKFCCFPARLLVCILSVIGITHNVISILFSATLEFRYQLIIPFCLTWIFLNILLLFGAFCNNERALKWSLRVVIACMILTGLYLMVVPVMIASFFASGVSFSNGSDNEERKKKFVDGLISGYSFELIAVVLIGAQILKYIVVNRLWEYESSVTVAANRYDSV